MNCSCTILFYLVDNAFYMICILSLPSYVIMHVLNFYFTMYVCQVGRYVNVQVKVNLNELYSLIFRTDILKYTLRNHNINYFEEKVRNTLLRLSFKCNMNKHQERKLYRNRSKQASLQVAWLCLLCSCHILATCMLNALPPAPLKLPKQGQVPTLMFFCSENRLSGLWQE